MMDASGGPQEVRVLVFRGNRVDFETLVDQPLDEIDPEIVDVPGGVENNRNFHQANFFGDTFGECR
jgi:hypothetical protein